MTYSTYFHWANRRQKRLSALLVAGCTAFLVGCDDAAYPSNKTIRFDEKQRDLYVQPIQVCNDSGQECARVNVFADITARILEQARLKVNFLPGKQLNESRFLTINDRSSKNPNISEFSELSRSGGSGAYGRHPQSTRNSGPINVWFVDEIESKNGLTQFGLAYVDGNGVLISGATLDYSGGKGRVDTLAHEIGHNLGLSHTTFGAGGSDNLLTSGGKRNVPDSPSDVYPNGAGVSKLTLEQLTEIVNSPFVNASASDSSPAIATAADLSAFTMASLKIGAGETANRIPEPSIWSAIALVGLSSMLLLKRQKEQSLQTAMIPIPASDVVSRLTAHVECND